MPALVISDLHIDKTKMDAAELRNIDGIEAVLFTGDICDGAHNGMPWLADRFAGVRILMTLGNHDVWRDGSANGYTIEEQYERCRELGYKLGIEVLQNSTALFECDGHVVRAIGATLWTDFEHLPPDMPRKVAMYVAQNGRFPDERGYGAQRTRMNDFRFAHQIDPDGRRRRFTPARSIEEHKKSRAFIEDQLSIAHDGSTVVMTHHAASPRNLRAGGGRLDDMDFCYASDLEELMHGDTAPEYWISGHIHHSIDHVVGGCRLISNPRGYPTSKPGVMENPDWNPTLTIEIERRYDLTPRYGM